MRGKVITVKLGTKCGCGQELKAEGWQCDKLVKCEACAVKSGHAAVFALNGVHPWVANPKMDGKTRYALCTQEKQPRWVQSVEPLTYSASAGQARMFSGVYLNTTNWHWSLWQSSVTATQVKAVAAKEKTAKRK